MTRPPTSTAAALALALVMALPASAQQDCPQGGCDSALDRLMGDLMARIDPWFRDLGALLGDLSGWHAPEVLPNGDILIRRRAPETAPEAPPEAGGDQDSGAAPFEL